METSTQSVGEQPAAIRLLLAGGAIGPLLFIVVFLIEGATRPHYSVCQRAQPGGGLTQRIFLMVGWSWIAVLAIRLMSRSVPLA